MTFDEYLSKKFKKVFLMLLPFPYIVWWLVRLIEYMWLSSVIKSIWLYIIPNLFWLIAWSLCLYGFVWLYMSYAKPKYEKEFNSDKF